jgi:anhydro-N-acetylmuramic acid kinase
MQALRAELGGDVTFGSPEQQGVPSDAKEAIAFALLGAATLDGEPSNVPSVTGARRAVVLGSITPKPC